MAIILHYFTEFGSFKEGNCAKVVDNRPKLQQKCSSKNLVFGNTWLTVIFSDITEKKCVKERHPHSKARSSLKLHNNLEMVWDRMYVSIIR